MLFQTCFKLNGIKINYINFANNKCTNHTVTKAYSTEANKSSELID